MRFGVKVDGSGGVVKVMILGIGKIVGIVGVCLD